MNTAYLIQQIEQLLREQDSIYHSTAVRFGLSDTQRGEGGFGSTGN